MGKDIDDRIIFTKPGEQRKFLATVKTELNMSWLQIAKMAGAHRRSFSDWAQEKYRVSQKVAVKLSALTSIKLPHGIRVASWQQHVKEISPDGYQAVVKKYGRIPRNEKYRRQQWRR